MEGEKLVAVVYTGTEEGGFKLAPAYGDIVMLPNTAVWLPESLAASLLDQPNFKRAKTGRKGKGSAASRDDAVETR